MEFLAAINFEFETTLIVVGVLCLLVALVILFYQPEERAAKASRLGRIEEPDASPDEPEDTRYRSARVRPGLLACNPAMQLADRVFLSSELPKLPLPGCGLRDCGCHYVFLDDRRSGLDRRVEMAKLGRHVPQSVLERRRSPGRRIGDLAMI